MNKPAAFAKTRVPKGLRRLNSNELVSPGDFVRNEHQGIDPWEGPSGFRADSFVKPIYRLDGNRVATSKKGK
jgi:hypothetical protein